MADSITQLAEAEALYRHVNEGIASAAERFEAPEAEFVCECSDLHCADRFVAPLDEYEQVRGEPTTFLLAPGHEEAGLERVVRRRHGYWIVEKMEPTMRRIVRGLDTRTRPEPDAT
jgi:hypothetical protein